MKKLIALAIISGVLAGCSNSGDKFVGTWTGKNSCEPNKTCTYPILQISKNDGGNGYTVKWIDHTNPFHHKSRTGDYDIDIEEHDTVKGNFPALLDGNTLAIDMALVKEVVEIVNNQIEFEHFNLVKQ
jgi:hypothetical protein